MRHTFDQQLQISEFIKDPASLKLLILAGTNIRANQLITVNKCVSLIKLDLSSNQLSEIPLKFANFPHLKIVYLHDNQITAISVTKTNLEYISLFDNPIKDYRSSLIESNQKLMAIDQHVIAKSERLFRTSPHPFSQLKWPIVQISQALQHEEDYLNLLKAELFVINQVYKRANFADVLNKYFLGFKEAGNYQRLRHTFTNEAFFQREFVKVAASHWIEYAEKKKKLRRLLEGTPAEDLLMNKLERIRHNRSTGVSEVLSRFLKSIRQRMIARFVLARSIAAYRSHIPIFKYLVGNLQRHPLRLHFLQSQSFFLQKIFLFAKKLFFNKKVFDILDNFDKFVIKAKKTYYIYRKKQRSQADTILLQMVRNSMGLILGQKGIDKRSIVYNRQGHKKIQIKRVKRIGDKYDKERTRNASQKIERLYGRYDVLVSYQFKNNEIYQNILRLIKYFNAGNSHVILQNQAAYFQTEVIFEDKTQPKVREKLFFSSHYYIRRTIAANAIQKWWRRIKAVQKCERRIIKEIRVNRAQNLIGRWLRDLTFRHKMQLSKIHSFTRSTFKQIQLLMQLDIYINLPIPTDLLRIKGSTLRQQTQYIYEILHKNTQVEIVELSRRSWIKFRFLTSHDAFEAQKQLSIITYRYYFNGTYIKLFSLYEVNFIKDLAIYESRIHKLFHLKVNLNEQIQNRTAKKIQIDNMQPYFIWPYLDEGFGATMFKQQEVQSLPISVFIYNKNRRPLKVNCDLMWIAPSTLYHFRKRVRPQVRVRTPKKEKSQAESYLDHYMPHIQHKLRRERQFSMKQHKSLLQANRQRGQSQHVQLSLLSQTLNIKRQ